MNLGIYIHIPFCGSRCGYCHFVTHPWSEPLAVRYAGAVQREIVSVAGAGHQRQAVDTVYFGGGTPSMVDPGLLRDILGCLRDSYDVTGECEISIEANPETVSRENAEFYLHAGIRRISLGAQSFSDVELEAIGRRHAASQTKNALSILRQAGFRNISLDLILGLPEQTRDRWRQNLMQTLDASPEHVSVYMLDTDDARAPIHRRVLAGHCLLPDEDMVADCYAETVDCLGNGGLNQYEISNFARAGFECRHNLKYWRCEPVLGFGASSHSFDGCVRYSNVADLGTYMHLIESERSPVATRTRNDPCRSLEEILFLGLRLNRGVDLAGVRRRYGGELMSRFEAPLESMSRCGLLEREADTVRLTARGRLLSNEVFSALLQ